jgi:transmembrane sensor
MNNKDRTWYLISKKLAGEANAEELAELEDLLRSDPEMHYALQHINDLWSLPVKPGTEAEDAFDRHLARLQAEGDDWQQQPAAEAINDYPFPSERSSKRKYLWIGIAATVVIAAGIFIFYKPGTKNPALAATPATTPTKNEVSTRNGSRTKISLPDGSQVWLNSGSNIVYNKEFGNGIREVELSGEAFFDVVKNAGVPFIIHTKQVDIKVVGTAFNVRSYPTDHQTETSLVRGLVEVTIHNRPEEKILLKPNEKLVVADRESQKDTINTVKEKNQPFVSMSNLSYTPADSIVVETAWVQDKLVFDNESFVQVAAKMERWYNVQFEFRDSASKTFHFSGVFQNESIEQALTALRITAENKFRYTVTGNTVIITKK